MKAEFIILYLGQKSGITNTDFVFNMMEDIAFNSFHQKEEDEIFGVDGKTKLSDETIRLEIIKKFNIEPKGIGKLPKKERNNLLCELKKNYTIRQIEHVTGISRGVIHKS